VTAAFHDIEAQTASHEIEVLHDLAAAMDSLDHNAREGLSVKARTVENETEPVEEGLHDGGDLERIVWRGENDSIGGHHLVDQDVPVVFKRATLFSVEETGFAAATQAEVVVAEKNDFDLNVTERLQVVKKLAGGSACEALCTSAADEGGDRFHVPRPPCGKCSTSEGLQTGTCSTSTPVLTARCCMKTDD